MSGLTELYRDAIRRHAANPIGRGAAIDETHRHELYNAQCGDRIDMKLRLSGETIEAAAFDGEGCAICMASASLLCTQLPGHTRTTARRLHEELLALLAGDSETDATGPLAPLSGVRPYPARVRCATLPWEAAQRALARNPDPS
ncbi:MAG: SUF system NifU family Fe-S cluster assembly protein [Xanthomonadales bacterium]